MSKAVCHVLVSLRQWQQMHLLSGHSCIAINLSLNNTNNDIENRQSIPHYYYHRLDNGVVALSGKPRSLLYITCWIRWWRHYHRVQENRHGMNHDCAIEYKLSHFFFAHIRYVKVASHLSLRGVKHHWDKNLDLCIGVITTEHWGGRSWYLMMVAAEQLASSRTIRATPSIDLSGKPLHPFPNGTRLSFWDGGNAWIQSSEESKRSRCTAACPTYTAVFD